MMASIIRMQGAVMVVMMFAIGRCTEAFIGMNWGRQSAQRLVPSQVVDLMLQNGIRNVRIYTTQSDILQAFEGSRINITATIFDNTRLKNKQVAQDWVRLKYPQLITSDVRTLIVGNVCVFDKPMAEIESSMEALNNMQSALEDYGLGDRIKGNFLHRSSILINNITKPSSAEFLPQIKGKMIQFLRFLRRHDAPFLVEMFPITDLQRCDLDVSFSFNDNNSSSLVINDGGATYTNGFDWQYDCFAWAIDKLNFSDIKIVVNQIGWPTDGYPSATAANAERFYRYLLPRVASNRGTPRRPGAPIDIFVHALTDEPRNPSAVAFGRHWGIYRSNGEPKYKIDLSGKGRNIYPAKAKNIMRMPSRWCVFNGHFEDFGKVKAQLDWACEKSDCTSTHVGGSCSRLSFKHNVTYAFNMFFQFNFQDEKACDFQGLGFVSDKDPSTTKECVFPVEVVRGRQLDFVPPSQVATGEGFKQSGSSLALFLLWFSMLHFL